MDNFPCRILATVLKTEKYKIKELVQSCPIFQPVSSISKIFIMSVRYTVFIFVRDEVVLI